LVIYQESLHDARSTNIKFCSGNVLLQITDTCHI